MGYPSTVDTGGVPPWIISNDPVNLQSVSGTLAANNVYLYAFEVQSSTVITALEYRMGATVTGTSDMGIYDVNGNLLAHTGAITNVASATVSTTLSPSLSLAPGQYYLALCPSNSTDTYQRLATAASNSAMVRSRQTVTAGTSGVLPNTTGGVSTVANVPQMAAKVSGGLA